MFGNGLRVDIWSEFLARFRIQEVRELYGSAEENTNLGKRLTCILHYIFFAGNSVKTTLKIASCDNQVGSVGFIPRWAVSMNKSPSLPSASLLPAGDLFLKLV